MARELIFAMWVPQSEDEALGNVYEVAQGELQKPLGATKCDIFAVAHSPAGMVKQLHEWATLNATWPAPMRRELQAKLAEWQVAVACGSQVRYEIPLGEGQTMPVVFQFGIAETGN